MPRLPTPSDFPTLTTTTTPNPESPSTPPTAILLLLHGLGDTDAPFRNLATQLNLPHTAILTIRGPHPLPFDLGGFHWGDDITIDQSSGALDPDAGFSVATRILVKDVVGEGLVKKCGFRARDVVVWGFGQGGMVALAAAKGIEEGMVGSDGLGEMGGVISVGGPLPGEVAAKGTGEAKLRSPVIVLGGTGGTALVDGQVERIQRVWEFVERVKWRRSGDGMPRDRGEMMPIMQFLARRLRASAPAGTEEVSL